MCMGRAHDAHVRLVGALDVVDEPAPSGEQCGILAPRDPRADDGDGKRAGRHGAILAGAFTGMLDGIDGRARWPKVEVSITVQSSPGQEYHGSLIREARRKASLRSGGEGCGEASALAAAPVGNRSRLLEAVVRLGRAILW